MANMDGVIAGKSRICRMDLEKEKIFYFGHDLRNLAEGSTFENVAFLLLQGKFPPRRIKWPDGAFVLPQGVSKILRATNPNAHPMDMLALAVRALGNEMSLPEESLKLCLKIAPIFIARVGMCVGAVGRLYQKKRMLYVPRVFDSAAKNIFYQLLGREPDNFEERILNMTLVLYAEHESNAGTFADRVVASTHSDMYSTMQAGIAALKGPRHGGANEEAMKVMLQIGSPENVEKYCDKFFEKEGARLPGFGHPVYVGGKKDPRVGIFKPHVLSLSKIKMDMRWYEIAERLEEYVEERCRKLGKPPISPNIDLWTAPAYYLLGISIPLYTPLFVASRVAGWIAHFLEVKYILKEHIYRPRLEYIGPMPQT